MWRGDGSESSITDGQLVTQKGACVILEEEIDNYLSVSVDAKSTAVAGIILNYTDKDNYLVGIYSPAVNKMCFHEVIGGDCGAPLGSGDGPLTRDPRRLPKDLPEDITLTVDLQNGVATLELTSGEQSWASSIEVKKNTSGKLGLWHNDMGDHQRYSNFKVVDVPNRKTRIRYLTDSTLYIERLSSPQDWILVMEQTSI